MLTKALPQFKSLVLLVSYLCNIAYANNKMRFRSRVRMLYSIAHGHCGRTLVRPDMILMFAVYVSEYDNVDYAVIKKIIIKK